ncbi:DUF805 domain-containing protein [Shewanella loihica]|uniref:DUF805 domain-containing protein n=1 Tax=Shewanella loihica (strain ATCC BAA-1088 / PV-4) TaxID=323850 RepID=A3QHA9_SHELP|nr:MULTISPECIES: DUF805 domain-containing protein [Shewanella]ABO24857.1 protein of unknown function DUF805 [Shewanella loihica PV-4]MCG9714290.1 DUF805 domain-containing protein [Shewanella insulae]MCG9739711.1 DUF805 domain-containing protein [Shewanella insulae]QYJ81656.1 DUF805 domain-containing protein [Shewanella aegiceratis]QYJ90890.1 DUF805 domain-containing protein [Shewanella halotolerans]
MEYFIGALKKFADFTGRARRKEFWMFTLFYIIFYAVAATIDVVTGLYMLSGIFSLALLIPTLAISARRLHDTGRSGWWQLIGLIPLIGAIVLIVFYVQDSVEGNEYGENPKALAEA